jgi:protein-tyrosine-phosphatase
VKRLKIHLVTKNFSQVTRKLVYDWVCHWNELTTIVNKLLPHDFSPGSGAKLEEIDDVNYILTRAWLQQNKTDLLKLWHDFTQSYHWVNTILEDNSVKPHKNEKFNPDPFSWVYSPETLYDFVVKTRIQDPQMPWSPDLMRAKRMYEYIWIMGAALAKFCDWVFWPKTPPNREEMSKQMALIRPIVTQILILSYQDACWSPVISALLQAKLSKHQPAAGFHVICASFCEPKGIVPENAVQAMRKRGINVSDNATQKLNAKMINWCDLILTLGTEEFEILSSMFLEIDLKMFTLKDFDDEGQDLSFPVFCSQENLDATIRSIDSNTDRIAQKLSNRFEGH